MLERGDRVLLAVSGGPDSTALVEVFTELAARCGFEIEAAHFNHRLRGDESDRDERVVEGLCERLGVACHIERAAEPPESANVEQRARLVRYRFLARKAEELRCRRIATGHTMDDQAETVLMRLIRGSGLDGLVGIRAVRSDGVIRPLIERERSEVLAYLEMRGVTYVTDSMNMDRRFLRVRLRNEVMPILRELNPAVRQALARTARVVAGDVELLDRQAADEVRALTSRDGTVDLVPLGSLPASFQERILRTWLKERRGTLTGVSSMHLRALYRLVDDRRGSKQVQLPAQGIVSREYGRLRFRRAAGASTERFCHTVTAGVTFCVAGGWRVTAELVPFPGEIPPAERSCWYFWADADALSGTMHLRNARLGDRIQPLGLAGHRKLQDLFVDRKLPRNERWRHPVLEVKGHLLWVPGLLRSRHALVSPGTRSAWRVVSEVLAVAAEGSLC